MPVTISSTLNTNDVASSSRSVGRLRRAASSAPPSAPTAKTADASAERAGPGVEHRP